MRSSLPALLIGLLVGAPELGHARALTGRMSCAEAIETVKREGEAQVATPTGVTERIVRDRSFCDILEIAELRFLPMRDNPQCAVGYRCREPDYEDWNWD